MAAPHSAAVVGVPRNDVVLVLLILLYDIQRR
jgi:hypothetical protein